LQLKQTERVSLEESLKKLTKLTVLETRLDLTMLLKYLSTLCSRNSVYPLALSCTVSGTIMEIGKDYWELKIAIEPHTHLEPLFWPRSKQAALVRSDPQNT